MSIVIFTHYNKNRDVKRYLDLSNSNLNACPITKNILVAVLPVPGEDETSTISYSAGVKKQGEISIILSDNGINISNDKNKIISTIDRKRKYIEHFGNNSIETVYGLYVKDNFGTRFNIITISSISFNNNKQNVTSLPVKIQYTIVGLFDERNDSISNYIPNKYYNDAMLYLNEIDDMVDYLNGNS